MIVRSRTVDSTATYRCNAGYTLVGNTQRTCRANGRWSGEEPICEGSYTKQLAYEQKNFKQIRIFQALSVQS